MIINVLAVFMSYHAKKATFHRILCKTRVNYESYVKYESKKLLNTFIKVFPVTSAYLPPKMCHSPHLLSIVSTLIGFLNNFLALL